MDECSSERNRPSDDEEQYSLIQTMEVVAIDQIPKRSDITDAPSDTVQLYKLYLDMVEVCEAKKGCGLSAVQVGVPWRVSIVKGDGTCPLIEKDEYGCFVNCDYEVTEEETLVSLEGCLSVRSSNGRLRLFQVRRFKKIKVIGYKLFKVSGCLEPVDVVLGVDEQGVVFQHELDHQRGILISDHGTEIFLW